MDQTRRSLCGLGIASVPLAVVGPKVLSAAQEAIQGFDPLLDYLERDTKRRCRLALVPGPGRAQQLRALDANLGMLVVSLHARARAGELEAAFRRRVEEEGVDGLAQAVRRDWPARMRALEADYGVQLPPDLDPSAVSRGIESVERYGIPRMGPVRRWLEAEAGRVERSQGHVGLVCDVRQTPGNDFGPPGWAAGAGDPEIEMNCWDWGLVLAAMVAVVECFPEFAGLSGIVAILGVAYYIACVR